MPETLLAPGFRMENIVTAISDKTYHGAPGIREWFGDSFDGVEGARFQLEHVIADGDDFVSAAPPSRAWGHGPVRPSTWPGSALCGSTTGR